MNTQFFENASVEGKKLGFHEIFSDTFKPHSKESKGDLLARGIGDHIPAPDRMLRDWQKPWLFARIALIGLLLSIGTMISSMIFPSAAILMVLFMLPAFVMPLALLIFYWEMNIPGNVSIYETLFMMLLGGILSLTVTGIVRVLMKDSADIAFLQGPFPEELAKFVIVFILLSRKKYRYGLQGILIGGAVGAGFAAIESAGYALNAGISGQSVTYVNILRALLAVGGHTLWAAMYGGALALAKGKGSLKLSCICNSLFLLSWTGAYLLHTAWNFNVAYLAGILPDGLVIALYYMETYFIKHILLIVIGWMLLMMIMRKCLRQMVRVDAMYQQSSSLIGAAAVGQSVDEKGYQEEPEKQVVAVVRGIQGVGLGKEYPVAFARDLVFGRKPQSCDVCIPDGTAGVSSMHCKITWNNGSLMLMDLGSTYGTFLLSGEKLTPHINYPVYDQMIFCLGGQETQYIIQIIY